MNNYIAGKEPPTIASTKQIQNFAKNYGKSVKKYPLFNLEAQI